MTYYVTWTPRLGVLSYCAMMTCTSSWYSANPPDLAYFPSFRFATKFCSSCTSSCLHLSVEALALSSVKSTYFSAILSCKINHFKFKDTCYGLGKNSQNQQLLDILACNPANRPSLSDFEKMNYYLNYRP